MKFLTIAVLMIPVLVSGQFNTRDKADATTMINAALKPVLTTNTSQDKTITTLTSKGVIHDTAIAQLQRSVGAVSSQLNSLITSNKTKDSLIADLQRQLNAVSALASIANLEANKHDTITNVPGETTITQISPTKFAIGIYNYGQLTQQVQALEAKKP